MKTKKQAYQQKKQAEQWKFTEELILYYLQRQEDLARSVAARFGEDI